MFIIAPSFAYVGYEWYEENSYRWETNWHPKVKQLMIQTNQLSPGIEFLEVRSNGYTVGHYPMRYPFKGTESTLQLAFDWDETIQPFNLDSFNQLIQWVGEPNLIVDYEIVIQSWELSVRNDRGKLLCQTPANAEEKDYCAPLGIENQTTYSSHVEQMQKNSNQLPQGVTFRKGYSEEKFIQLKEAVYAFTVPQTFSAAELKQLLHMIKPPTDKWAMEFILAGSEYSWIRLELQKQKITGCSSPNDRNFTCETIGLKAWQIGD